MDRTCFKVISVGTVVQTRSKDTSVATNARWLTSVYQALKPPTGSGSCELLKCMGDVRLCGDVAVTGVHRVEPVCHLPAFPTGDC